MKNGSKNIKKNKLNVDNDIEVMTYLSYRDYLQALFDSLKEKHGNKYSYYKFAEDLGLSKSNVLWLVVTGRRKLTQHTGTRITGALGLDKKRIQFFKILIDYNNAMRPDKRESLFQRLIALKGSQIEDSKQQDIFAYYTEWYNPIICEMTALDEFQSDYEWISGKLSIKIKPAKIKESLSLLEKLGLIYFDKTQNRHFRSQKQVMPDKASRAMTMIRYHQKMCEMARDALTTVKANKREMNALTISADEETAQKIAELLYKASEKIMSLEEKSKKKSAVYQINMQLFPIVDSQKER